MNRFFVPGSKSGSYVASKRDKEGSFIYDKAAQDVGIQKQAALQDLSKSYSSTIENAYASYLASQRGIQASSMGQGYKDWYAAQQEQALISQVAEANKSVASARQEIESQAAQMEQKWHNIYETEVTNLDKVATSMSDYLEYIKGLGKAKDIQTQLGIDINKPAEEMYEQLYSIQPQSFVDEKGTPTFVDEKGTPAMPFMQWIKSNLKDTQAEAEWADWLFYKGGWQDFKTFVGRKRYSLEQVKEQQQQEAKAERVKSYQARGYKYLDNIKPASAGNNNNMNLEYGYYTIDGQKYFVDQKYLIDINDNISKKINPVIVDMYNNNDLQVGDAFKINDNIWIFEKAEGNVLTFAYIPSTGQSETKNKQRPLINRLLDPLEGGYV